MEQLQLPQSLGLLQSERKIANLKISELEVGLERLQLKQPNLLGEGEVRACFAADGEQHFEALAERSHDLRASDQMPHPEHVLAVEHHSFHGLPPSAFTGEKRMHASHQT